MGIPTPPKQADGKPRLFFVYPIALPTTTLVWADSELGDSLGRKVDLILLPNWCTLESIAI